MLFDDTSLRQFGSLLVLWKPLKWTISRTTSVGSRLNYILFSLFIFVFNNRFVFSSKGVSNIYWNSDRDKIDELQCEFLQFFNTIDMMRFIEVSDDRYDLLIGYFTLNGRIRLRVFLFDLFAWWYLNSNKYDLIFVLHRGIEFAWTDAIVPPVSNRTLQQQHQFLQCQSLRQSETKSICVTNYK